MFTFHTVIQNNINKSRLIFSSCRIRVTDLQCSESNTCYLDAALLKSAD